MKDVAFVMITGHITGLVTNTETETREAKWRGSTSRIIHGEYGAGT